MSAKYIYGQEGFWATQGFVARAQFVGIAFRPATYNGIISEKALANKAIGSLIMRKRMLNLEDILAGKDRLAKLEHLSDLLTQALEERQVKYGDDQFGRTGLYTRGFKIRGSREHPLIVEEYTKDQRLLQELIKLEQAKARSVVQSTTDQKTVVRFVGADGVEKDQADLVGAPAVVTPKNGTTT